MNVCVRSLDTSSNFEPIFTKPALLMRVHTRVNLFVVEENQPNRTTEKKRNVPSSKMILRDFLGKYCFSRKNIQHSL